MITTFIMERELVTEVGTVKIKGRILKEVYKVAFSKVNAVTEANRAFCLLCENSEEADKELGAERHDNLAMTLWEELRKQTEGLVDFFQGLEEMKLFEGTIETDLSWDD